MLKKIDPNTSLNILDIPSNIVADTYYYQVTDSGERILEEIKKLSNDFSEEIWLKRDKSIPLKKISEIFILASIIEKETF